MCLNKKDYPNINTNYLKSDMLSQTFLRIIIKILAQYFRHAYPDFQLPFSDRNETL